MDGTPARLVMLISMIAVNQFLGAYSSRYTALATPTGMAAAAVTTITSVLPTQADRMPACAGRRDGKLVKKSHDRRGAPSSAMSTTRAVKVSAATARQTRPTA